MPEEYENVDGELLCTHVNMYVEKACCPPASIVECGCGGVDSLICPNDKCTGITDSDVDKYYSGIEREY